MMAFHVRIDEVGRKTVHPSPALEELLKQDRIAEKDLRVFRSSNKVQRLLEEVLTNRGFKRDAGEWRKDALTWLADMVWGAAGKLQPYEKAQLNTLEPPPVPKISIVSLIQISWCKYLEQFGHHPNALFITPDDLLTMRTENPLTFYGSHFGSSYQGMVLYEAQAGMKPYCCTIVKDGSGLPAASDAPQVAKIKNALGEAVAVMYPKAVDGKIELEEWPNKAAILLGETTKVSEDVMPAGKAMRVPKAESKSPPKLITPPSQMRRKLAL